MNPTNPNNPRKHSVFQAFSPAYPPTLKVCFPLARPTRSIYSMTRDEITKGIKVSSGGGPGQDV